MEKARLRISGTGCALVDYLYKPVSFTGDVFTRYRSARSGDGGLCPGKLVFKDEFEEFSGEDYLSVRRRITGGNPPVALNIGGPSVVSLIHAAQILNGTPAEVCFYGSKGRDEGADFLDRNLRRTPLKIGRYKVSDKYTPFTDVLSDPDYDDGHGERIFINNIGAAMDLLPEDLDESFFESDMVVFGGTALVPNIHRCLLELLEKAKSKGAITVVNTVYDSLSEKKNPREAWPMGSSRKTFDYIDLLMTDMEEALRLSGCDTITEALSFFAATGLGALIVTHGAQPLHYYSRGGLFGVGNGRKPTSRKIRETILQNPELAGDTTGCGDNFAGGVIASVAMQLMERSDGAICLEEAIAFGTVSGGFACLYNGGTFFEEYDGQKKELIAPYYAEYLLQESTESLCT